MRLALSLAKRAFGATSPNPMVGAVLVKKGKVLGRGWHRRAGEPHAEVEAICDARKKTANIAGATLYVTLEPCCTHGRTPPCTDAIRLDRIGRVVVGAIDPNPAHAGKGLKILRRAGIHVTAGVLAQEATRLNESFNHWIVHRTPLVTVKAAMSLDGKIATHTGESKWITGAKARAYGMKLRLGADAIAVGVNTILADDPSLTCRPQISGLRGQQGAKSRDDRYGSGSLVPAEAGVPIGTPTLVGSGLKVLRRIVLDSLGRTPLDSLIASDKFAWLTTVIVTKAAPKKRVAALSKQVKVWVAPARRGRIDLRWLLRRLGAENVTSLLVEGGGEVNASFLLEGLAHRVAFSYAPKIIGGRDAIKALGGDGVRSLEEAIQLREVEWRLLGPDLLLTGKLDLRVESEHPTIGLAGGREKK